MPAAAEVLGTLRPALFAGRGGLTCGAGSVPGRNLPYLSDPFCVFPRNRVILNIAAPRGVAAAEEVVV